MRLTTRGRALLAALAALAVVGVSIFLASGGEESGGHDDGPKPPSPPEERTFESNDPVERGCALDPLHLTRIWRGHDLAHSEDVTTVALEPNYSGAFRVASHSGPGDIVQTVPLVLYGPGIIEAQGAPLDKPATVADIYPTVGELVDVPLEQRAGKVLSDALADTERQPKVIVTVVWDGVGRNVLERWVGRWPTLARMEREGTSYLGATVGSSPSITPATHSTMGVGAYPRKHGVTAIVMRQDDGSIGEAFKGKDPSDLELSTFADQIDVALDNEPLVGILAWKSWHIGMMGHGAAHPGGDADHMAIIAGHGNEVTGNASLYTIPTYLSDPARLDAAVSELDTSDGEADGEWRGSSIEEQHDNPAWVNLELDLTLEMLEREGYGADDVPDLFFTNYKMSDIVGHQYGIAPDRFGDVLEAQDAALGRLIDYLDENVGDYVVVVTADHGFPPPADESGAWPIGQNELERDVNREFGAPEGESLLTNTSAVGPFLNRELAAELGVTARDVAEFLNGYTIADNWREGPLPEGYEDRGDENVFAAAWPGEDLPAIMSCAFPN